MKVKDFLNITMLSAMEYWARTTNTKNAYKNTIVKTPRIICKDGVSLSVQVHQCCHAILGENINKNNPLYSTNYDIDIKMAETDCLELDQFGIDTIEDIQQYVDSHGGIDIQATIEKQYNDMKKQDII